MDIEHSMHNILAMFYCNYFTVVDVLEKVYYLSNQYESVSLLFLYSFPILSIHYDFVKHYGYLCLIEHVFEYISKN